MKCERMEVDREKHPLMKDLHAVMQKHKAPMVVLAFTGGMPEMFWIDGKDDTKPADTAEVFAYAGTLLIKGAGAIEAWASDAADERAFEQHAFESDEVADV